MKQPAAAPFETLRTAEHGVTYGSFRASPSDPHIARREALLSNATRPHSPTTRFAEGGLAGTGALHHEITEQLWSQGLAVVQLDEPLPRHRFTELGEFLGTAIPEKDPAVQPYVQEGIVLNLRSRQAPTKDVSLQPFARNSLSLHSESSGAGVAKQPRYIVLMCVAPGDGTGHAQTVLVPMREVARWLSPSTLELLSRTGYRDSPEAPAIARHVDDRWVFSYRDFLDQELRWTHSRPDTDPETVNAALRELLAAMYAPGETIGVRWRRGLLVVIDNTYHFHGRTAGTEAPPGQERHLQRLRIR
jgi:hypothetical protein